MATTPGARPRRQPSTPAALGAHDLPGLILGGEILGSGGGGDLRPFASLVRRVLAGRRVEVVDPGDLGADAAVVPVGIVGATVMLTEKLPSGLELSGAVEALQRWSGRTATAVMTIEAGGINALTAIAAAAELGLPLVDADLVGRSVPRLDQFTLAAAGVPMTPCALCEPGGATTVVDGRGPVACEETLRAVVAGGSGWAAVALRALSAGEVSASTVVGSLARARSLGEIAAPLLAGASADRLGGELAEHLGGVLLGGGRVQHALRRPGAGGFGRATFLVQQRDQSGHAAVVRVEAENEYLAVIVDGELAATCPDLVVVLDRSSRAFVRCEALRAGQDVWVMALPAPAWWTRAPERLDRVGPRAFGIDAEPVLVDAP